jgi:glyoxylase-like metal-dependent hydrolase (beta-lactamase superfamily II)
MVVKELALLSDGFFELDMGMLVWMKPQYYGVKYRCALKSLLIITDEDRILVDTGCGQLDDDMVRWNKVEKDTDLIQGLRARGLGPEDITVVINTHLHFDHCGWNREFKNARLIVQKEELGHAHKPYRFQKAGYHRPHFEGLAFELMDGDVEILDGIHLVTTPGHTPGHQSVVVEHEGRNYIFCGDAGPLRENIEKRNIIGITTDPVKCLESIDKLRAMEGNYIYAHDNTQMDI